MKYIYVTVDAFKTYLITGLMKFVIVAFLSFFMIARGYAQNHVIDSLDNRIANATSDTQKISISVEKLAALQNVNLDTAIAFGNGLIARAKNINYKKGEAAIRTTMALQFCYKGAFDSAARFLAISDEILTQINDSIELAKMYNAYGTMYAMQNQFDKSNKYYITALFIARRTNQKKLISSILQNMAIGYQQQSNYPKALEYYQNALRVAQSNHDETGAAYIYLNIAITYESVDDEERAETSYLKAVALAEKFNLRNVESYSYANLASLYGTRKNYVKEYDYAMKSASIGEQIGDRGIQASSLARAGHALALQGKYEDGQRLVMRSIGIADSSKQPYNIFQTYVNMGDVLTMQHQYQKAIPYYEKGFRSLTDADLYSAEVGDSYSKLAECYEKTGNFKKALASYKIATKISDSIRGKENIKKSTELTLNYEFKQKQDLARAAQEKKDAIGDKVRTRQYSIIAMLAILVVAILVITIIQFKNNKQKYKANLLLGRQKLKAENALTDLEAAQAQLIQSEKMASLGELTAGIAHEIQNPLNFINNFSDVNTELLSEMKAEMARDNFDEAKSIANDVIENEQKINHHGKRADAIVKGMLQHSRKSTGQKEPVDLNALADEYLRLSYHGLRAKDKSFNAEMKTDFDQSIGKIHVISQDIGRVLLNLYNNAFYAVAEKKKLSDESYKPTVSVITKKVNDRIEIIVSDNGNGIPKRLLDKIFQPFYTTKPTGEGTGLGLSLSYDIIKSHGGTLEVDTKEGEGSEFTINLPAL